MEELVVHKTVLVDRELRLRPLTENDWNTIAPWETDPEVLWYSEGDEPRQWTIEEWQPIYRNISQSALMFVVESERAPIGTAWLHDELPGKDIRRIDLQLGKSVWGKGLGTRTIRLLTKLAFEDGADCVFAAGVWDFNARSQRAFLAAGYRHWRTLSVEGFLEGRGRDLPRSRRRRTQLTAGGRGSVRDCRISHERPEGRQSLGGRLVDRNDLGGVNTALARTRSTAASRIRHLEDEGRAFLPGLTTAPRRVSDPREAFAVSTRETVS